MTLGIMLSKSLHQIITACAFRQGKSVRDLYHELTSTFQFQPTEKECKLSKLISTQGFLQLFTEEALFSLRSVNNSKNRFNKDGALTGSKKAVTLEGIRHYEWDSKFYPSVTTVLKHTGNDITKYIRLGYEKAASIRGEEKALKAQQLPLKVGNYIHSVLEAYLLGLPGAEDAIIRSLATHLNEPLLSNIDKVIAVEYPVHHAKFGYAGTIDAVVQMKDGSISLLDWKTSLKKKTPSGIKDYFAQAAAYSLALYAQTGIKVDNAKVCIVYRQAVGVRKPTRHDIYTLEGEDLRNVCYDFIQRTKLYREGVNPGATDLLDFIF